MWPGDLSSVTSASELVVAVDYLEVDDVPCCELPPVGRSRWLRGQVGLGLIVLLLPIDGSDVAERRVPSV